MSIPTIERPTLGAQIGGNLGRTLAEQLPQEVERQRLSYGLKNLANRAGNMSPIEQLAEMQKLPGMTPQLMSQIQPYLASQRESELSKSLYGGAAQPSNVPAQAIPQTPQVQIVGEKAAKGKNEFAIPAQPIAYMQQPQEADYARRANEMYAEGKRGITYQEAAARAEKEMNSKYNTQQKNLTETETAFDKNLTRLGVDSGEVPPEVMSDMLIRAQNASGSSSPQEAANKYTRKVADFAKQRANLSAEGATKWYSASTKEGRNKIASLRKYYEDIGQLETFKNDLISRLNLSERFADTFAYPVEKRIAEVVPKKTLLQRVFDKGKPPEKVYADIGKRITPNDSINSIAVYLDNNGYDALDFKNLITRDFFDNLNERQQRELSSLTSGFMGNLNDIWFGASRRSMYKRGKNG